MRKGFTVLELLVASLLLGMLMTILTMIFNQSSIAWRTGIAGVADFDSVRDKVAEVRYRADNAYVWNGNVQYVRSVFAENGDLVCDKDDSGKDGRLLVNLTKGESDMTIRTSGTVDDSFGTSNAGRGDGATTKHNYVVNVRSVGPDRKETTRYDNIYSVPYDPNDWNW